MGISIFTICFILGIAFVLAGITALVSLKIHNDAKKLVLNKGDKVNCFIPSNKKIIGIVESEDKEGVHIIITLPKHFITKEKLKKERKFLWLRRKKPLS